MTRSLVVPERRRVAVCSAFGIAVVAVGVATTAWQLAVLLGWITTAVLLLAWIWGEIRGLDDQRAREPHHLTTPWSSR